MHVCYIMIKSSQKFWVVYVRYRFIPEQCALVELGRNCEKKLFTHIFSNALHFTWTL
jgi:hypothetical protein